MLNSRRQSITIAHEDAIALRASLFTEDGCENLAVLFCGYSESRDALRLLARERWSAPTDAYVRRLPDHLEIAPTFLNRIVEHALATGLSPVIVHSHPRARRARYSASDDFGEGRLMPVFRQLLPGQHPASLLVTHSELRGRQFIGGRFRDLDEIRIVGLVSESHAPVPTTTRGSGGTPDLLFDRQVRAIGASGQRVLSSLRVAIVGAGGTGSVVAEQAIRLGVRDLVLVDPDVVERVNLTRLYGSTPADVGKLKVDVVASHLRSIAPDAIIETLSSTVVRQSILRELRDRDLIFGCTDNHWSRAVLNRFAHQYLIPVVDMGVRIDARVGSVTAVGGQVSVAGAGLSCLRCSRLVDANRVADESRPLAEQRRLVQEGYVQGMDDPEPSVISLNTTIAGMAVTAGVSLFTSLLGFHPQVQVRYDATRASAFSVEPRHDPGCDVCWNLGGVRGLGDLQAVSAYE